MKAYSSSLELRNVIQKLQKCLNEKLLKVELLHKADCHHLGAGSVIGDYHTLRMKTHMNALPYCIFLSDPIKTDITYLAYSDLDLNNVD